ncbi:GNAT family N-acetyltransferase [Burkholderia arboris]|uniref:GNAT family N-acetyltransferase n=1 Tax=Burkholderia arboris TaxID=488730 RepID=A0ABZ3DRI5_9BURK
MNVTDTDLTVRMVREDDYDQWLPLWDGYNRFYGRFDTTALPLSVTQLTWSRFFDGYEPVHALVAEHDGRLVGLVHFLYHRSTTHAGPSCYLQDLFTLDSERGKGVGRALIEAVYDAAHRHRAERVYWQTHETNHTARRLYDTVADRTGGVVYRKALPR